MWVSKAEMRRLLQQLAAADQRAQRAEDALVAERQSKDWLLTQLTSRIVTKHGGYGLDHEKPEPQQQPAAHPLGYTREPTEMDLVKRDYYIRCYREAGKSEDEAIELWEAEMRGEQPVYEFEREH